MHEPGLVGVDREHLNAFDVHRRSPNAHCLDNRLDVRIIREHERFRNGRANNRSGVPFRRNTAVVICAHKEDIDTARGKEGADG